MSAPAEGGNGYEYGSIPVELYIVDGGSIDWAYGELGVAAISTELGPVGGGFLPAFTCIDNPCTGTTQGLWPENKGMLTYMAKLARTPYLLTHGPDAKLISTNPMTVTQGTPSVLNGTINYAWTSSEGQNNRFGQNVGAAFFCRSRLHKQVANVSTFSFFGCFLIKKFIKLRGDAAFQYQR